MENILKNNSKNFKYSNGRFFNIFVHVGLFLNVVLAILLTYLIIFDLWKWSTYKKNFMIQYGMDCPCTSLV